MDFVSSLPDDRIDMSLTARGHTMHLTCGRFTANIKGIDAEDFPAIPTVSDAPVYSLPPAVLKSILRVKTPARTATYSVPSSSMEPTLHCARPGAGCSSPPAWSR